mmetsp:Transcript_24750/g.35523  ORF Transcript_24750/g.35523 Transcript_24750/m.35523 type:complete len:87 (-) Transcript_24750:8-268(-)
MTSYRVLLLIISSSVFAVKGFALTSCKINLQIRNSEIWDPKEKSTAIYAYTKHSPPMPAPLPKLKHSYYLLRHGQSLANVEGATVP